MVRARYDGHADWYDEQLTAFTASIVPLMLELAGEGPGRCLDLGCGGGVHQPALAGLGWTVVGVDLSADQLRVARRRTPGAALARASADALPFLGCGFDLVVMAFVHTDMDDWPAALAEAARVLRPGGRLLHLGIHPCFNSGFARHQGEGLPPVLLPGYRDTRLTHDAPTFGIGLRRRVGARHVPLASVLNAIIGAGLTLERADEPGDDYPRMLTLVARR